VNDFYASNYSGCLRLLTKLKPILQLDMHLWDHVATIYELIRQKTLIQYFTPYSSVNMTTMAAALNTDVAGLESELQQLIMNAHISARIDSHNKILYARHTDERTAIFQRALQNGEEYLHDSKALLVRMNLFRHNIIAKAPKGHRGDGDPRMHPMDPHHRMDGPRGMHMDPRSMHMKQQMHNKPHKRR